MYRAFLLGILLLAAYSHAATVAERIAELDAAPGVSDVSEVPNSREAHPVFTGWEIARLEYRDVTLTLADTTSYPYGEDVNIIRFNSCVFDDDTTGAGVVTLGYRSLVTYIDNCSGDLGEQEWNLGLWSSDIVAFCMDGNNFGTPATVRTHAVAAWELCANKVRRPLCPQHRDLKLSETKKGVS